MGAAPFCSRVRLHAAAARLRKPGKSSTRRPSAGTFLAARRWAGRNSPVLSATTSQPKGGTRADQISEHQEREAVQRHVQTTSREDRPQGGQGHRTEVLGSQLARGIQPRREAERLGQLVEAGWQDRPEEGSAPPEPAVDVPGCRPLVAFRTANSFASPNSPPDARRRP
jgi:hypothetical protein